MICPGFILPARQTIQVGFLGGEAHANEGFLVAGENGDFKVVNATFFGHGVVRSHTGSFIVRLGHACEANLGALGKDFEAGLRVRGVPAGGEGMQGGFIVEEGGRRESFENRVGESGRTGWGREFVDGGREIGGGGIRVERVAVAVAVAVTAGQLAEFVLAAVVGLAEAEHVAGRAEVGWGEERRDVVGVGGGHVGQEMADRGEEKVE